MAGTLATAVNSLASRVLAQSNAIPNLGLTVSGSVPPNYSLTQ